MRRRLSVTAQGTSCPDLLRVTRAFFQYLVYNVTAELASVAAPSQLASPRPGQSVSDINHQADLAIPTPSITMSARIVDVRLNDNASNGEADLRHDVIKGLLKPNGQKTLPTLLLYDEEGLRIYDEITVHADEYYLFPAEENLFKSHANEIIQIMHNRLESDGRGPAESVVLELGAGYVLTIIDLRSAPMISLAVMGLISHPATEVSEFCAVS